MYVVVSLILNRKITESAQETETNNCDRNFFETYKRNTPFKKRNFELVLCQAWEEWARISCFSWVEPKYKSCCLSQRGLLYVDSKLA